MSFFLLLGINNSNAQIFKKLLNTVTKGAQGKAGDSLLKQNQSNQPDTASANRVLNAFAKAARDNPNDTSSADLTMKALGNLTGGGGVSAADSAAAIKKFRTASGGSGFYYETIITVTTKERGTVTSKSKSYVTNTGEGRSEMDMAAMMGIKNGSPLIGISRGGLPGYSIIIDDKSKTYSLNVIDTSLINGVNETYNVTKIGNETVQGYNCIHSKLVMASKGMFKSSTTMEIWTSTAVPGYSNLRRMMSSQNITPGMIQALDHAGCGGYFVKIASGKKDYAMTMTIATAEAKTLPAALFFIPQGYAEAKGNLMFANMMQSAQNKQ
jgi:hypothetical protein